MMCTMTCAVEANQAVRTTIRATGGFGFHPCLSPPYKRVDRLANGLPRWPYRAQRSRTGSDNGLSSRGTATHSETASLTDATVTA
jgi:hypothetical protein